MKVSELKQLIDRHPDQLDKEVKLLVPLPSAGPRATVEIESASFGFDWDRGLLFRTKERLVPKENNQDIFEAANDLLMMLATECFVLKKQKFENRRSAKILLKYGYKKEDLEKYVKLFHRDKPIINTIKDEA